MSMQTVLHKKVLGYASHSTFTTSNTSLVVCQRETVWSCAALSRSRTVFQTGRNQASSSTSTLGGADTSGTWPVPLCVVFDLEEIVHFTINEICFERNCLWGKSQVTTVLFYSKLFNLCKTEISVTYNFTFYILYMKGLMMTVKGSRNM
jgi:hypothetical protein